MDLYSRVKCCRLPQTNTAHWLSAVVRERERERGRERERESEREDTTEMIRRGGERNGENILCEKRREREKMGEH